AQVALPELRPTQVRPAPVGACHVDVSQTTTPVPVSCTPRRSCPAKLASYAPPRESNSSSRCFAGATTSCGRLRSTGRWRRRSRDQRQADEDPDWGEAATRCHRAARFAGRGSPPSGAALLTTLRK